MAGRVLRWFPIAFLATACGGSVRDVTAWRDPISVNGTAVLELRPPAVIPGMWRQAADLELCFDLVPAPNGPTGAASRDSVVARLEDPRFRSMRARVLTDGSRIHALDGHKLVRPSFCLKELPVVHGTERAVRVEIESSVPVVLQHARLRRVAHP